MENERSERQDCCVVLLHVQYSTVQYSTVEQIIGYWFVVVEQKKDPSCFIVYY